MMLRFFQKFACRYIIVFLLVAVGGMAQEIILEGIVRDANTHRRIVGVNIYIGDLDAGTVSNSAGKFELGVVRPEPRMVVTFQHVAYDTLKLTFEEVLSLDHIDMQERLILVPEVEAQIMEDQLEISDDFSRSVAVIEANGIDLTGFIDAGDLLRTDHSSQIDEELTGKKTVSIRGGSADEVIVLYNGIKMNDPLDNTFDLSLIDLADVQRFEIIKGSNTTRYGPEGFSGVINIVPRALPDHNFRVQQLLGTHRRNNTSVGLYRTIDNVRAAYNFKRGGLEREFSNPEAQGMVVENSSEHHNASVFFNMSDAPAGTAEKGLGMMFVKTDLAYDNERDEESLDEKNQMVSARFTGDIGEISDLNLSAAYQWSDELQRLRYFDVPQDSGFLDRSIETNTIHFNAERTLYIQNLRFLFGYQFKNAGLRFQDDRFSYNKDFMSLDATRIDRSSHGLFSLTKFKMPSSSSFFSGVNMDVSVRYDFVRDKLKDDDQDASVKSGLSQDSTTLEVDNTWREGIVKLSMYTAGTNGELAYRAFVNFGANVKFPTLLQQINTPELLSSDINRPDIQPERNRSVEVGFEFARETRRIAGLFGWQLSGSLFQNSYDNKFRSYFLPGTPVAIYDNVLNARMRGIEGTTSLFFFKKQVTMEWGASRYFFSDQSMFPFKHDEKYTFSLRIDQSGYGLQVFAFREGDQIAQIRSSEGGFQEQTIPGTTNYDLHFSKAFELRDTRLILNASMRNIIDDDYVLEGISLRDRRFYVTMGLEF